VRIGLEMVMVIGEDDFEVAGMVLKVESLTFVKSRLGDHL
jgi:hypothetical protein